MNNLDDYLEKIKTAMGAMGAEKTAIIEELFVLLGVRINKEYISVRENVVYISGSGSLKSQIFMKKNKILEAFQKHSELKNIIDIR